MGRRVLKKWSREDRQKIGDDNLENLGAHLEFGKVLIIVSIISILITCLIYFIFRRNPKYNLIKYIPGSVLTLIGVYNLLRVGMNLPDTSEFDRVLLTMIFIIGGVIGLFTGLIIGVINKDKKDKEDRKDKET